MREDTNNRRQRLARGGGFAVLAAALALATPASAQAPDGTAAPGTAPVAGVCAKAEFEEVVDGAAGALRDLNNQNRPAFQDKLRQLKDKRAWDTDAFLKEAAPFVKDEQIQVFDDKTNELLTTITSMGQEGVEAKAPDCALLGTLKDKMRQLVETQTAKWSYMFSKLDAELNR